MIGVLSSALLTALSMPGMFWGGLIWVALIPLLLDLQKGGLWKGTLKAFFFAYAYLMICHYWVLPVLSINVPEVLSSFPPFVGVLSFFLMGVLMAFSFLGFGFLYKLYAHKFSESLVLSSLFTASLFTLFDWLRSLGQLGFTGGSLADAFTNQKGLLQLSSFGGPYLLVFLVVFVNAMLACNKTLAKVQGPFYIHDTLNDFCVEHVNREFFAGTSGQSPIRQKYRSYPNEYSAIAKI